MPGRNVPVTSARNHPAAGSRLSQRNLLYDISFLIPLNLSYDISFLISPWARAVYFLHSKYLLALQMPTSRNGALPDLWYRSRLLLVAPWSELEF